jgi:hypothetical protein
LGIRFSHNWQHWQCAHAGQKYAKLTEKGTTRGARGNEPDSARGGGIQIRQ